MFGSLGFTELILILVIVLIIFGAGKLPQLVSWWRYHGCLCNAQGDHQIAKHKPLLHSKWMIHLPSWLL